MQYFMYLIEDRQRAGKCCKKNDGFISICFLFSTLNIMYWHILFHIFFAPVFFSLSSRMREEDTLAFNESNKSTKRHLYIFFACFITFTSIKCLALRNVWPHWNSKIKINYGEANREWAGKSCLSLRLISKINGALWERLTSRNITKMPIINNNQYGGEKKKRNQKTLNILHTKSHRKWKSETKSVLRSRHCYVIWNNILFCSYFFRWLYLSKCARESEVRVEKKAKTKQEQKIEIYLLCSFYLCVLWTKRASHINTDPGLETEMKINKSIADGNYV